MLNFVSKVVSKSYLNNINTQFAYKETIYTLIFSLAGHQRSAKFPFLEISRQTMVTLRKMIKQDTMEKRKVKPKSYCISKTQIYTN